MWLNLMATAAAGETRNRSLPASHVVQNDRRTCREPQCLPAQQHQRDRVDVEPLAGEVIFDLRGSDVVAPQQSMTHQLGESAGEHRRRNTQALLEIAEAS